MTAITNNPVSNSLLAAMNPAPTATSSADAAQNKFMKLLITQMQHQDPMNPMDNAQITSQLAQLSTVTGIDKLNTTLQSLAGSYQASQSLQATAMIGKSVLVPGNNMTLANGSAPFGVNVTTAAGDVTVNVQNAAGQTVAKMDLGAQPVGSVPLAWDGTTSTGAAAPAGQYTFTVNATSGGQNTGGATGLSYGAVQSVSTGSAGVMLNVANVGAVSLANVVQTF
ncbi:MAG: flagellar hook assembly protein FlgD [Burkholderiales bacterium]